MANTSNIKYCEYEEPDYVTGSMIDMATNNDVASPVVDWRRYASHVVLGAALVTGTSGVAIGNQAVGIIPGLHGGISSNNVVYADDIAEVYGIERDDISVPRLRHAGVIRGHFSKPQKLKFSADLLD